MTGAKKKKKSEKKMDSTPSKRMKRSRVMGEHVPTSGDPEFDLQVVAIVNGYRQPRLLQEETGSAAEELLGGTSVGELLSACEEHVGKLLWKARFREATLAAYRPPTGPQIPGTVSLNDEEKKHFFENLAQPTVPLDELYKLPRMGWGIFMDKMCDARVPIPRAVWAYKVAEKNLPDEGAFVKHLFEKLKSTSSPKESLLAYVQAFVAYAFGEKLLRVAEFFKLFVGEWFSDPQQQDKDLRSLYAQFLSPFWDLLYSSTPMLALTLAEKIGEKQFLAALDRKLSPEPRLPFFGYESLDDVVHQVCSIVNGSVALSINNVVRAILRDGLLPQKVLWPIVYGVLVWGELQWPRSDLAHGAVVDFVSCIIDRLYDVKGERHGDGPEEGLCRFAQRRTRFAEDVISLLIRRKRRITFDSVKRWFTLSSLGFQGCAEFLARISCPEASLHERPNIPFRILDLDAVVQSPQSFGGEEASLLAVVNDFSNFELDFGVTEFLKSLSMGFHGETIGEFSNFLDWQNRLFDVALIIPGGEIFARTMIARILDLPDSIFRTAQLISAKARIGSFAGGAQSELGKDLSDRAALLMSELSGPASSAVPAAGVLLEEVSLSETAISAAKRPGIPKLHSLLCLKAALDPKTCRMLATHCPVSDPVQCLFAGAAQDEMSKSLWGRLWNARFLKPLVELPPPCEFSRLQQSLIGVQFNPKAVLDHLGKPVYSLLFLHELVTMVEALSDADRLKIAGKLFLTMIPLCCSHRAMKLYAQAQFGPLVAHLFFLMEGAFGQLPRDGKLLQGQDINLSCVAHLERLTPLPLAALLKKRLVMEEPDDDARGVPPPVVSDPANTVAGWRLLDDSAPSLLTKKMLSAM